MSNRRKNSKGNNYQRNKRSYSSGDNQKPEQIRKLFLAWSHELLLSLEIRERNIAEDHMVVSCFISFIENSVKAVKFIVYKKSFENPSTAKEAIKQYYDYSMCDENTFKYLNKFYNLRNQLTHELVPYKISQYAKLISKNKNNIDNIIYFIEKNMNDCFKDNISIDL